MTHRNVSMQLRYELIHQESEKVFNSVNITVVLLWLARFSPLHMESPKMSSPAFQDDSTSKNEVESWKLYLLSNKTSMNVKVICIPLKAWGTITLPVCRFYLCTMGYCFRHWWACGFNFVSESGFCTDTHTCCKMSSSECDWHAGH